ncbi:catalase [Phlegmacium glaucopus]|nr:catalase [Phlegmacium glaucopus]
MAHHYTTSYGSPVNEPHASQRVSTNGPLLLQDFHHIDNLAHLARERIPERLVHAKAAGAHGYFEVTHDLSDITSQTLFHQINKKVDATVRFSTVAGESGSADTARDVHGFAIKLKTDDGIFDWVLLNTPTFFIRDPAKYPDLVHVTKRNSRSNLKDPDMLWDFFSQNTETAHQVMMIFSDRGTPDGFHQQHGFSGTTFKLCKTVSAKPTQTDFVYFKLHVKTKEVKTLTAAQATVLAGTDPDYGTRKLYDAIEAHKFPEWTVSIQTMKPTDAMGKYKHIAFDVTKVWPHTDFPLREIGKLVLNKNPENYFDEIEQLAFSPSHLIPYIEPSPDPLLQARLFIYPDTQRYRLGVNNQVANYQRAGAASVSSQGGRPNYMSSTQGLKFDGPPGAIDSQIMDNKRHELFDGTAYRDLSIAAPSDYLQPAKLWEIMKRDQKDDTFVENVSGSLKLVKNRNIVMKQRMLYSACQQSCYLHLPPSVSVFKNVDKELADRIGMVVGVPAPQ